MGRCAFAACVTLALLLGGCSTHPRAQLPSRATLAATPAPTVTGQDVATALQEALLAGGSALLADADREVAAGRLERARDLLRDALAELAAADPAAPGEGRVQALRERLGERLHAVELALLVARDAQTTPLAETTPLEEILDVVTGDLPPPEPTLKDLVAATLRDRVSDVPIPLNAHVLGYVELFRTRLRTFVEDGLRRSGRYLPMIQSVFRAEGLPLDLAYVALIESAFKPTATSRARARGVWQFMRSTAREHGLRQDWYVDERLDPEKATYAAARYLKTLAELFDGDWFLALASYNGGPARVERAIARTGQRNFWTLAQGGRHLPRETREYVPMVLAAIIVAKNPLQFGLDVVLDPPVVYETVTVPQPVDLRRIAEWAQVSLEELLTLNPELRRWVTPVTVASYDVKVPPGTAEQVRARLEAAEPRELAALRYHTVRRGETLASVARRLKVSRAELAEANGLPVRARLHTGQLLVVPRQPALALVTREAPPARSVARLAPTADWARRVARQRVPDDTDVAPVVYRVRPGDTLAAIARRFDTTVEHLQRWNGLRTTRLRVGARLLIYRTRVAAAGQG